MKVYVAADIEQGNGIIGVYTSEEDAWKHIGSYSMAEPGSYKVYTRELNLDGVLQKNRDFLLLTLNELMEHRGSDTTMIMEEE